MPPVTEIRRHIPTPLTDDIMTTTQTGPASDVPQRHEPEEASVAGNPKSKGKVRSQKPMRPTSSKTAR